MTAPEETNEYEVSITNYHEADSPEMAVRMMIEYLTAHSNAARLTYKVSKVGIDEPVEYISGDDIEMEY